MPHSIGTTEPDLSTVEIEFSFRLRILILTKSPHSKGSSQPIQRYPVRIEKLHLNLIEPRAVQIPDSCLRHRNPKGEKVYSVLHLGRDFRLMVPVQIPKATQGPGRGLIFLLLQNSTEKVLAKYRNL